MILLSIHPEFVNKIRSGEKKFEFRTRIPASVLADPLVAVYATAPVGAVVGYFRVGRVLALPPASLWEQTKEAAGIARGRFRAHVKGRAMAEALEIAEGREVAQNCSLDSLRGASAPPQSFVILTSEQRRRVLRRATKGQGK